MQTQSRRRPNRLLDELWLAREAAIKNEPASSLLRIKNYRKEHRNRANSLTNKIVESEAFKAKNCNVLALCMYGTNWLAWLWLPVLFYASTAIGQIGPDTGALQRQLQLQLERARPAPLAPSLPPAETRAQSTNEQKIKINGFIFKGNRLQSAEKLNATVARWTEREVLFTEIPDITTAIQDSYAKLGRLAVANIPPQEVKDGLVVIEILEAKLGRVHIDTDQTETVRFTAKRAKRFLVERNDGTVFINTKSFERAITLINELSGVRAEGSFEAGEKFGLSDIRVKLTDGPLFSGQVATSNYGSSSTGNIQAIANLSLNNPFRRGDQITLDAIQSLGSTYVQLCQNS